MTRARGILALLAALAALALLAALGPGGASAAVRISSAGSAAFPDRAFVLTLPPGRRISAAQVHVTENGRGVAAPSLVPAAAAPSNRFGVVLVIDTSASMRGSSIAGAVKAAREFAARRNPRQRLGIVEVNRGPSIVLTPTADRAVIDAALAGTPPVAGGTHLYDGVEAAIEMLRQARISAGSIVVLSDGADNGSRIALSKVASNAVASGIRVFTVGLQNRYLDPSALGALATQSHGRYAEASSPAQLSAIYASLAAQIGSQYLLSYRSLRGPGQRVSVDVAVDGLGHDGATYATPRLARPPAPAVEHGSVWTSTALAAAVSILFALLIGSVIVAAIVAAQRRRAVQIRLADFTGGPDLAVEARSGAPRASGLMQGAERSLEGTRWWAAFKDDVEMGRIEVAAVNIAVWCGIGALFALFAFATIAGSLLVGILMAALVVIAARAYVSFLARRQRSMFAEQLADNLQVIASAMRAGNSFAGALAVAVEDAAEPARSELRRAVIDERLGVPFDEALQSVSRRTQNDDLQQVILVASLQREIGGNTAEILDQVAETIRERSRLRRFVHSLTAQGRLTRWVVTILPIALTAVLSAISPGYLDPLFHTHAGQTLLVLAGVLVIAGSLVIKRIVDIKV